MNDYDDKSAFFVWIHFAAINRADISEEIDQDLNQPIGCDGHLDQ